MAVRILYASSSLIVISKPPGLLCVPGRQPGMPDAVSAVKAWLGGSGVGLPVARDQDGAWFNRLFVRPDSTIPSPESLRAAHRLDMATSGVVAFAADSAAHSALSRMLQLPELRRGGRQRPRIEKTYVALVDARLALLRGFPVATENSGVIRTPLRSNSHQPILVEHDRPSDNSRPARACETQWRVLARGVATIRLELRPITGRTHQLRVHMALPPPLGLGCPIIGDNIYGDPCLTTHTYLPELMKKYTASTACETGSQQAECPATSSVVAELVRLQEMRDGSAESTACGLRPEVLLEGASGKITIPSPVMLLHARDLVIPDFELDACNSSSSNHRGASTRRNITGTTDASAREQENYGNNDGRGVEMDPVGLTAPRDAGTGTGVSVAASDVGMSLMWPVVDCRLSRLSASTGTPPAPAGAVSQSISSSTGRQDELGGPKSDVYRHRFSPVVPSTDLDNPPPTISSTTRVADRFDFDGAFMASNQWEPGIFAPVSKTTVNVLRHRRRPGLSTSIESTGGGCIADVESEVQQIDAVRFYDPPAF